MVVDVREVTGGNITAAYKYAERGTVELNATGTDFTAYNVTEGKKFYLTDLVITIFATSVATITIFRAAGGAVADLVCTFNIGINETAVVSFVAPIKFDGDTEDVIVRTSTVSGGVQYVTVTGYEM